MELLEMPVSQASDARQIVWNVGQCMKDWSRNFGQGSDPQTVDDRGGDTNDKLCYQPKLFSAIGIHTSKPTLATTEVKAAMV